VAKNLNLLLKPLLLSIRIQSRISSKKGIRLSTNSRRTFDIPIRREGNVPSSKEELLTLSYIKDALKILTRKRKVIGFLIEDPITK
jgi:hypothetical protein